MGGIACGGVFAVCTTHPPRLTPPARAVHRTIVRGTFPATDEEFAVTGTGPQAWTAR